MQAHPYKAKIIRTLNIKTGFRDAPHVTMSDTVNETNTLQETVGPGGSVVSNK